MNEETKKFIDEVKCCPIRVSADVADSIRQKALDIIDAQAKRIEELEKAIRDVRDTLSEELYLVRSGLEVGARPSPNGIICTLEKAVKKLNKGEK